MGRVDAEHRAADAEAVVEAHHLPFRGALAGQPAHQVQLRPHRPPGASRALLDGLDDSLGGADGVGLLHHLEPALRVDDHAHPGNLGPAAVHHLRGEPVVDGAVSLPEQDPRPLDLSVGEPAPILVRVPDRHRLEGDVHPVGGVSPQVLVREEQHSRLPAERPLHDRPRVRRGAHGAAVPPHEGLQVGGGVHVGDGQDLLADHRGHVLPRRLHLPDLRHVGHGAAGVHVRQGHGLVGCGEDVGRLLGVDVKLYGDQDGAIVRIGIDGHHGLGPV